MTKNPALIFLLGLLLVANFIALVIALTNIWPDNPLKEHRLLIGIAFIVFGGLMRQALKRKSKDQI